MKAKIKKVIRSIFSRNTFLLLSVLAQIALFIATYVIAEEYATKILGGTISILAFFVALIINNSDLHPDIKISYLITLVLFPLFGMLIYLLSIVGTGKRKYRKYLAMFNKKIEPLKQNHEVIEQIESQQTKNIANYLYGSCNFPIYQNTDCKYFKTGEEQFIEMLKDLKEAQHFIFLEYYIIENGFVLNSIMQILEEKVKQGVEVRFMYDGTSSIAHIPHSFCRKTNKLGIKCKMFMPVRAIISTEQNNRDHRKFCIIDNKIAYTGGLNLSDEYINKKKLFGHWKDVGVRIEGEAVSSCTRMFLKMWNFKQKEIEDFSPYLNVTHTATSDGFFIPIGDQPHDQENVSKSLIIHALSTAKKYVHITTPYLIIDDELRNTLCSTAKRGVDVKIITPAVPDKKTIFYVTLSNYYSLIQAGVKIYQYTPGFIHAKMIVCDDIEAIVGTINLDYRSLYLNFENCIYAYNHKSILVMEEDFNNTINDCKIIDISAYKKINIFKRFIGRLLKIFAPLM